MVRTRAGDWLGLAAPAPRTSTGVQYSPVVTASAKSPAVSKRSGGDLLQGTVDRCGHAGRDRPTTLKQRRGIHRQDLGHRRLCGRCVEGRLPGEHLIEHARQRVLIAPSVQLTLRRCLLRAHIGGRAHAETGLRNPVTANAIPKSATRG